MNLRDSIKDLQHELGKNKYWHIIIISEPSDPLLPITSVTVIASIQINDKLFDVSEPIYPSAFDHNSVEKVANHVLTLAGYELADVLAGNKTDARYSLVAGRRFGAVDNSARAGG